MVSEYYIIYRDIRQCLNLDTLQMSVAFTCPLSLTIFLAAKILFFFYHFLSAISWLSLATRSVHIYGLKSLLLNTFCFHVCP